MEVHNTIPSVNTAVEPLSTGTRLHPGTLLQRLIRSLPAILVILAPSVLGSADANSEISLFFMLFYGLVALPLIVLHYYRFVYWITPKEIIIHSGVITRRKRNIPIDRIQNIVVERSLLPRLLGLAKVKVETAGSGTTEGVLEYVSLQEARDIREQIRSFQHRPSVGGATTSAWRTERAKPTAADPALLFSMTLDDVLLSGTFRFSLLYLVLIFSGFQYVSDVLGPNPEEMANWLVEGRFRPYAALFEASPFLLGLLMATLATLLGWLSGILIHLNKYFHFRLTLEDNKLHWRHGLLTVSEGTLPLSKIQTIILRSNPFMRIFNWYWLEVQSMGYDVEQEGYQVLIPFAKKPELLSLAQHIRPFSLPKEYTPVSRLTIRRSFIRYTIALTALVLPLSYFSYWTLLGFAALPALFYFAVLQYKYHGYSLSENYLFIRRGVIKPHTWVIPLEKLQVFYATSSFFQRRRHLSSLTFDTAGAGTFRYPKIVDVDTDTGRAFLERTYQQFQGLVTEKEKSTNRPTLAPPPVAVVPPNPDTAPPESFSDRPDLGHRSPSSQ